MANLVRRLDANHDMTFGGGLSNYAQASEACAQKVRCRLLVILGEWFLDLTAGVPYIPANTERGVDATILTAAMKQTITATTDVQTLNSFTVTLDRETRIFGCAASITTIYGDTLNIQVP